MKKLLLIMAFGLTLTTTFEAKAEIDPVKLQACAKSFGMTPQDFKDSSVILPAVSKWMAQGVTDIYTRLARMGYSKATVDRQGAHMLIIRKCSATSEKD